MAAVGVLRACNQLLNIRWWAVCADLGGLTEVLRWRHVTGIQLCKVAAINGCYSASARASLLQLRHVSLDVAMDVLASELCGYGCVAGGYAAARARHGYHTYAHVPRVMAYADIGTRAHPPFCPEVFGDVDVFLFRQDTLDEETDEEPLDVEAKAADEVRRIVKSVCGVSSCSLLGRRYGNGVQRMLDVDHGLRDVTTVNIPQLTFETSSDALLNPDEDTFEHDVVETVDDKYVHVESMYENVVGVSYLYFDKALLGRAFRVQLLLTDVACAERVIQTFDMTCSAAYLSPSPIRGGAMRAQSTRVTWRSEEVYNLTMANEAQVVATHKLVTFNSSALKETMQAVRSGKEFGSMAVPLDVFMGVKYLMKKWALRGYKLWSEVAAKWAEDWDHEFEVEIPFDMNMSSVERCAKCGKASTSLQSIINTDAYSFHERPTGYTYKQRVKWCQNCCPSCFETMIVHPRAGAGLELDRHGQAVSAAGGAKPTTLRMSTRTCTSVQTIALQQVVACLPLVVHRQRALAAVVH